MALSFMSGLHPFAETISDARVVQGDLDLYSGKHGKHGMNRQVIAGPDGDIVWVSGPLPGAVHDLTAPGSSPRRFTFSRPREIRG
jgi:DDE superfamily endonuclease